MKRLTIQQFIEKSNKVHNFLYDYTKAIYEKSHKKIIIICKIHGEFEQFPYDHLNGKGCRYCANNYNKSIDEFIKLAKVKHKDFYLYPKSEYINNKYKIEIICKIHGSFFQRPNNHLMGAGCIKCKGLERKNTNLFIELAKQIHGDLYDYSKVEYVSNTKKVEIICKLHGSFMQRPSHHIHNKSGCMKCKNISSKAENRWLDFLNIPSNSQYRQVFIKINSKKYRVDAYDNKTNTIYEFLGDYWHGNLKIFNKDDINQTLKKTFGKLNEEWLNRKTIFESNGYNVVYIWENDFYDLQKGLNI